MESVENDSNPKLDNTKLFFKSLPNFKNVSF